MNLSPNELQRRRSNEGRSSNNSNHNNNNSIINNQQRGQNLSTFGLAAQWLEQQQQQPHGGIIDPALLRLDSATQQQEQQQQRMFQQQQQQLGGGESLPTNDFDLQNAYLRFDLQRRNQLPRDHSLSQQQQQQQQQEAILLMMGESRNASRGTSGTGVASHLAHDLASLLAASAATPGGIDGGGGGSSSNNSRPVLPHQRDSVVRPMDSSLIDHLLAAELSQGDTNRRSTIEETARMLHLHEALQTDSSGFNRRRDTHSSTASSVGGGGGGSGSPMMRFQTTNSAPQDPHILPAMFNSGSVGLLPLTRTQPSVLFDSQFRLDGVKGGRNKRKGDDMYDRQNTEKTRAKATFVLPAMPLAENSSFPLPSKKQARNVTFHMTSFRALWDKLEESEMQEEAFRRRIFEGIQILGKSRSALQKP